MSPTRDIEGEAMDEELVEAEAPTVGEQLRAAREEKGLSLEDIAAQTRIPRRHLESLESSDWEKLPAPTYTIGFAKSFATAVGLERADIGEQLRAEMGGQRPATAAAEVFEPVDPARTMPKGLVFGAIAAVIVLVLVMSWLSRRSLEQPEEITNVAVAEAPAPPPAAAPPPTAAPQPVVLTATDAVWLQVYERGGATLFSGMLQPGQTFAVPPTATAPLLKTGKPEALKVTVGNQVAPPVGPPATTVSDVSLLAADLLKPPPAASTPAPAPQAAATAPPRRPAQQPRRSRSTAPTPTPAAEPPPAGTVPPPPPTGNAGA
ncbi:MAG TPA: helix-turn-helix domain-containing protein [Sphingomicrobium sp.]|nr:helix-turn-helix domain-containing protein [Sphingomicrobium sp.]